MTHLRKIMLEELHRRNYAQTTIDCYVRTVEHFSRYFQRSPEQLGPQHIREYQAALFKKWKLAPNTVNQRLAALRFFYIQTLKRAWSVAETPYPKKVLKLPIILSQEEIFTRQALELEQWRSRFHAGHALPGISEEEAANIVHSELGLGLSQRKIQKLIAKSWITDLRNGGQHSYVSARRLFWVIRELQAVANGKSAHARDQ